MFTQRQGEIWPRKRQTIFMFYGLRRRNNCSLLVAESVTDLLVPSSVMPAAFVTQVDGAASAPACSNAKPGVSPDGQETVIPPGGMVERKIESGGSVGR